MNDKLLKEYITDLEKARDTGGPILHPDLAFGAIATSGKAIYALVTALLEVNSRVKETGRSDFWRILMTKYKLRYEPYIDGKITHWPFVLYRSFNFLGFTFYKFVQNFGTRKKALEYIEDLKMANKEAVAGIGKFPDEYFDVGD